MEKLFNCTHFSVDCVENDPVDARCGGPGFLGFDFYVLTEQIDEMETFTREALKEFEVPLIGFRILEKIDLPEEKVWTKEKIVAEIQNDAQYLQSAEERAISLRLFYEE